METDKEIPVEKTPESADGNEQWDSSEAVQLSYLKSHVELARMQHRLASSFYRSRYIWWSLLPSALLTMTGGILAFLAQSDQIRDANVQRTLLIITGCFSALSTFLQTLAGAVKYNTRADMHATAAHNLHHISTGIGRKLIGTMAPDVDSRVDFETFETRFHEAVKGCSSAIPLEIGRQFERLDAQFVGKINHLYPQEAPLTESGQPLLRVMYNELWQMSLRELYVTISEQPLWPWYVPDVLDQALQRVKLSLEGKDRAEDAIVRGCFPRVVCMAFHACCDWRSAKVPRSPDWESLLKMDRADGSSCEDEAVTISPTTC